MVKTEGNFVPVLIWSYILDHHPAEGSNADQFSVFPWSQPDFSFSKSLLFKEFMMPLKDKQADSITDSPLNFTVCMRCFSSILYLTKQHACC